MRRIAVAGICGVVVVWGVSLSAGQNAPPASAWKIWNGVYTEQQAARGREVVHSRCAACHEESLSGGEGPSIVGGNFVRNWGSRYLDRLYKKIKERMPPGEPFVVTDAEKVDVTAYILQLNGFPAGQTELTMDMAALGDIQIVGKNGPEAAPTGALIEIIGCLQPAGTSWQLTHSTEPAVSTMDDVAADAAAAQKRPLGAHTVRLLDVFPKPDAHAGHKMLIKGLLIRSGTEIQANVLALEMVSPSCP